MILAAVTIAWHLLTFTVPYDTTGAGDPGQIATIRATAIAADSSERPLPLYADSVAHAYAPRQSGQRDTAWVRLPADGLARMIWLRAHDWHLPANVGPRSNAVAIYASMSTFAPPDTLIISTRGPVRDGVNIKYTAPTRSNPAVHAATFSYRDSLPEIVPPFVGGPAAVTYEEAMRLAMRQVDCDTFGYWTLRGMRMVCP